MADAKFKQAAKKLKDTLARKYETAQTVQKAGAIGSGKLQIGGQIYDGTIDGVTTVVNTGRLAAATYAPKVGGGVSVSSSGGSSSSSSSTGTGSYLPLDGSVAMTGDLNMGNNDITNVATVDGRDVAADGALLDGLKAAPVLVVGSADANFTNERALAGTGDVSLTDGGANASLTIGVVTTADGITNPASILKPSAGAISLVSLTAGTSVTTPLLTAPSDLTLDPTGEVISRKSVGIGPTITATGHLLHLSHNVSTAGMEIESGPGEDAYLQIGVDGSTGAELRYDTSAAVFKISVGSGGVYGSTALVIDRNTGRVGVGADTTPTVSLQVTGTASVSTSVLTPLVGTVSGDLKLEPAGVAAVKIPNTSPLVSYDFESAFPIEGFRIGEDNISGQSVLTIGKIVADELWVKIFVANETRVDRGTQIWAKSYGITTEGFTTPAIGNSIRFRYEDSPAINGQIFSDNDWLLLQYIDDSGGGLIIANVWGQVTNYVDEDPTYENEQSFLFTMRHGPVGAEFKNGSLAIDFGQTGQAVIELSTVDPTGAPYIKLRRWQGADPISPSNWTTHVQIGQLSSISNAYVTPQGYGLYIQVGDDASRFLVADNTALQLRGPDLEMYNGASQTVDLSAADGSLKLGTDVSSAATTSFDFDGTTGDIYIKGSIEAAAGTILINTDGIAIAGYNHAGNYNDLNAVRFVTAGGAAYAGLYSRYDVVNSRSVRLTAEGDGTADGVLLLSAYGTLAETATYTSTITLWAEEGDPSQTFIQFDTDGYIRLESAGHITLIPSGRVDVLGEAEFSFDAYPASDNGPNLGRADRRWDTLYVRQIIADAVSGSTMSGAEWEFSGNMVIDANSASATTVSIVNQGTGTASLSVQGSITLGGTVDGVDLAAFQATYNSHVANVNAHHAQSHVLATTSGLGSDHVVSGLTVGYVLRATGTATAAFGQLAHSELSGLTTGDPHTQYLLKSGGTIVGNITVADTVTIDGVDISAHAADVNAHHNRSHSITSASDHTVTGATLDLVGLTSTNTLGIITPSSAPGAASAVLKTDSGGTLAIPQLTATTKVRTPLIDTASGNLSIAPAGGTTAITGALTVSSTAVFDGQISTPTVATVSGDLTLAPASGLVNVTSNLSVATLATVGTQVTTPKITSSIGDFTVAAGSRILLSPIGDQIIVSSAATLKADDYQSQLTAWQITYDGAADFRYIYADEMRIKLFMADLQQVIAGSELVTKSISTVSRDFIVPYPGSAATLYVDDLPSAEAMAVFESGDYVLLRSQSRVAGYMLLSDCWGTVTSHNNEGSKEQSWTFTRSGTATISTISQRGTRTTSSSSAATSRTVTKVSGTTSGDYMVALVVLENINAAVTTLPGGWELLGSGVVTGVQAYLYGKVAGGSEPANYTWQWDTSTACYVSLHCYQNVHNDYPYSPVEVTLQDTATTTLPGSSVQALSEGDMFLIFAGLAGNVRSTAASGTTERTDAGVENIGAYAAEDLLSVSGETGAYSPTPASSVTSVVFTLTLLPAYTEGLTTASGQMTPGTTYEAGGFAVDFGVSGNGWVETSAVDGQYGENSPYVRIANWTTHPATGAVVRAQMGNLMGLGFGITDEYGFYAGNGTTTTDAYLRLSSYTAQFNNIPISMSNAGTQTVNVSSDGLNVWIGTSSADKRLTWDGSTLGIVGAVTITAASAFSGSGYLQVGSGVKDSTLSGWHISGSEIVGQASGVDQVVMATTGKLTAGAGAVTLDVNGITLTAGTGEANKITWYNGATKYFEQYGYSTGATYRTVLNAASPSGATPSELYLYAQTSSASDNTHVIIKPGFVQIMEATLDISTSGKDLSLNGGDILLGGGGIDLQGGDIAGVLSITADVSTIAINGDLDMNGNDIFDVASLGIGTTVSGAWTSSGWSKAVVFASQGTTLLWNKGASGVARGIGVSSDGVLYITRSTANDNSAAPTYDMTVGTTGGVTISPAAGTNALTLTTPASQTAAMFAISSADNGSSYGPFIYIGRNSNGSTPASGFIQITNSASTPYNLWTDASGNLRIGTTTPTNAQDTSGTVVGTQTSSLDSKVVLGATCAPDEALQHVLEAASTALRRFRYKSGAFNDEEFEGIVTDYAPRYGMDRDDAHPAGKSLNTIQIVNDLMLSIKELVSQNEALSNRLAALEHSQR